MTAHQDEPFRPLTPGMLKIAELIADGLTNPQIAARLSLSKATISNRITAMMVLFRNPDRLPARHVIRIYIENQRARR